MVLSGLGIVIGVIALGGLALWLFALVELLQTPEAAWRRAGQDRLIWALVVLLIPLIGAILFVAIARPALEQARTT